MFLLWYIRSLWGNILALQLELKSPKGKKKKKKKHTCQHNCQGCCCVQKTLFQSQEWVQKTMLHKQLSSVTCNYRGAATPAVNVVWGTSSYSVSRCDAASMEGQEQRKWSWCCWVWVFTSGRKSRNNEIMLWQKRGSLKVFQFSFRCLLKIQGKSKSLKEDAAACCLLLLR